MQFRVFLWLLSLGAILRAAQAQSLDSLPQCSLQCISSGLTQTNCGALDVVCICQTPGFFEQVTPCILQACTADEVRAALELAPEICFQAGATLGVPGASSSTSQSLPSTSRTSTTTTPARTTPPSDDTNSSPTPGPNRTSRSQSTGTSTSDPGSKPTDGSETSGDTPEESGRESKAASGGIIAAGVLGGVIGIALIVGLVWFLRWRRKKRLAGGNESHEGASQPMSNIPIPPPAPIDTTSQGIWTGDAPYSWDPARQTPRL